MTQAERDAAIRRLRDRFNQANETVAAVLSEVREHQRACASVAELCDGIRRDASMRVAVHEVPDLPSREQLVQLLQMLRTSEAEIVECRTLLRQAGYQG
jgi:hypothetical protein